MYGLGDGSSGSGVYGISVSGFGVYGTNTNGGAAVVGIGNSNVSLTGYFFNLYVTQKMRSNHFDIAGGKVGMEVSWQVTGIRQDAYARAHPLVVEPEKTGADRVKYLYPTENGRPANDGTGVLPTDVSSLAHSLKKVTMPKPVKITPRKAKINHPLR